MKDKGYVWRPDDTLKLSLQEALQLGDGQALQNSDAGHFECSLVRNWRVYKDGSTRYEITLPQESEEDEGPFEEMRMPLDSLREEGEIVASGALGYNLIIASENDLVDVFARSLEEAEGLFHPYHPETQGWEPGYQSDTILMLVQRPGEELHIEIHNDKAKEEFYARLLPLSQESSLGSDIMFQVIKDQYWVRINVHPPDEDIVWKVGLFVAQTLHVSLDETIEDGKLLEEEKEE